MLFKLFNRIETWERLEQELGPVSWQSARFEAMSELLDGLIEAGRRVYSAAYIMPSPAFGHRRKHANHLAMLAKMMDDGLPGSLARASSMHSAYELILDYPGLGPFLAFQYTIDLNYSTLLNFDEGDFVVAGPGALDGIAKCFKKANSLKSADIIHAMVERQGEEFARLGLDFMGLFGRRLQPIDCQNLFCEISKVRTRRASGCERFVRSNAHQATLPGRRRFGACFALFSSKVEAAIGSAGSQRYSASRTHSIIPLLVSHNRSVVGKSDCRTVKFARAHMRFRYTKGDHTACPHRLPDRASCLHTDLIAFELFHL